MYAQPTDDTNVVFSIHPDPEKRDAFPAALREDEHALADFVRKAPVALAMFDRNMCYVAVSRPWTQMFGTGEREQVGCSHYDVFPDLPPLWRDAHQQALQGQHLSVAEAPWRRPDGTVSWHRWDLTPWHDAKGAVGGVTLFIENVTTPKAIDAVLRLLSVDAAGLDFNAFAGIATRRLAQILGVDMVQLAVPCSDDPAFAEVLAVFANGEQAATYRYALAGTPCDVALRQRVCLYPNDVAALFPEDTALTEMNIQAYAGSVLSDSRGEMLGVLSVLSRTPFHNAEMVRAVISLAGVGIGGKLQSHRAKAAIEASERFRRVLLDTVNSQIAVLDETGTIIFANEAWFSFTRLGGAQAEAAGLGVNYLAVCEAAGDNPEAAEAARLLREILSGARAEAVCEYTCPTPEGMTWFRCTFKRFDDLAQKMVLVAHENVSDIKQATRRSQQVERKFRHLFDNAPDATLIIDEAGIIQMANRQAEQVYLCPADALVGQPLQKLIRKNGPRRPAAVMEDFVARFAASPNEPVTGLVHGIRRDGSSFPADVSASRFVEEDATLFIVAVRDASLRVAAEADRLAREMAEQASQAKSFFLATMSHEIRTPLNAVLGFAEVLSHSALDADQNTLLQHMRGSAQHLLGLIDNVLDLSKIEAGEMTLEPEAFDLPELILENARALSGYALQRNVRISVFIDPALPVRIVSDPSRLRQVVYNLLGNAIKFSGGAKGTARVCLRVERLEDQPLLRITVRDTGIGMDEAVRARLFQPFVQGESTITRRFGGTGLGLAITKRIVDRLQGRITVDSAPGAGSTFRVTLPLEAEQHQPPAAAPRLKGLHCLVAASETYVAGDLSRYLEHEGARVTLLPVGGAASGSRAESADVVISGTDWRRDHQATPWVLVCDEPAPGTEPGTGDTPGNAICLRTGLLTCEALVGAVQRAFKVHAISAAPESTAPPAPRTGPRFDARQYRPLLVVEDDPMNQKVILRQLDLLGLAPDLAENGAVALEMLRTRPYGLILADLHMPVMDGHAMTAAIRAQEALSATRDPVSIVALTADVLRDDINRAHPAGFDGFLTKPMTLAQLAETLAAFLRPVER